MATKSENIVSYTAEEAAKLVGKTDWARVAAQTPEEIERHWREDEDEFGPFDWTTVMAGSPPPKSKAAIHMRIDRAVLDHFRKSGRGYQTRINAVLAAYVRHAEGR